MKKDRTGSILATISIILTTLLLAGISGAGYGFICMQKADAAELYGDFYGGYSNVSEENLGEMARHSAFAAIGKYSRYAWVDSAGELSLFWMDDMAMEMGNLERNFVEGHYPEQENEIAAYPGFFSQLGIEDPKIGDRVQVSLRTGLKSAFAPEGFVVCGILRQKTAEEAGIAYTSKAHFEKSVAPEDRRYSVLFRLDDGVGVNYDNAEDVMKELAVSCGINEGNVSCNGPYLMWKLEQGTETVVVCAAACAAVILFSVIVIYNIFQMGMIQRVQEYGKLKAVGATKKQIRHMVFWEGMYLACIGIPLGLLAGIGVAKASMVYLARLAQEAAVGDQGAGIDYAGISVVNIPLLMLVAALAVITVWIALKKPMRVAASISPAEAMRYQGDTKGTGLRKGKQEMGVVSLTLANFSRNRKRSIFTILSMGLSCVLFVALANWLGNMDEEYMARSEVLHGQFQLELNFSMDDEAYPENNLDHILEDNPLNEGLMQKIGEIPGVTDIRAQEILYARQLDDSGKAAGKDYCILVLDREDFEWLVKDEGLEGLDYDEMSAQDAVCYGWGNFMEDDGFAVGGTYHFSLYDGAAWKEWKPQMIAAFRHCEADMAMTKDTYEKLGFTGNTNYGLWVDCGKKDVGTVKQALESLTSVIAHLEEVKSYQDELRNAGLSMRVIKLPAYFFCIVIAFISFMNMANTIVTGIITRKQEFGVLQAVGMTNRQLDRSLQTEGMIFSLGTAIVSLAVGSPLGYGLFRYGKSHGLVGLNLYHFPVREVLFMLVFLGLLQAVLSFVLSRNVKRESLVERIRYRG